MGKIIRKLEDVEIFNQKDLVEYGRLRMRGISKENTIHSIIRRKERIDYGKK